MNNESNESVGQKAEVHIADSGIVTKPENVKDHKVEHENNENKSSSFSILKNDNYTFWDFLLPQDISTRTDQIDFEFTKESSTDLEGFFFELSAFEKEKEKHLHYERLDGRNYHSTKCLLSCRSPFFPLRDVLVLALDKEEIISIENDQKVYRITWINCPQSLKYLEDS